MVDDGADSGVGEPSSSRAKQASKQEWSDTEEDAGWMQLIGPEAATGPIFITISSPIDPSIRLALSANAVTQRVSLQPVAEGAVDPRDTASVWVCTRVPDSETKVTLRAATSRYLAADSSGVISADREARGEQEEWEIVTAGDGFALRTRYGHYMSADEVAGGKVEIRADAERADSTSEVWTVRMQRVFRNEMAKRRLAEKKQLGSGLGPGAKGSTEGLTIIKDFRGNESSAIRKFQAPSSRGFAQSKESVANLAQAQREGRLGEEMLDRRAKLKSDRYC